MRFAQVLALLAAITFLPCPAPGQQKATPPASLDELRSLLEKHVSAPRFNAGTFAVKVVSAASGAVVFEHDAGELVSPASNAKLYTVALALDRLGPDYKIRTSLLSAAAPEAGTLKGDLILFGRGDPCINSRLAKRNLQLALQPLVSALTNAGVRRIEGDLIADESYFIGPEFGSGWTWDDLETYYGAEISALTINDNVVVVSVKAGTAPEEPCVITMSPETSTLIISNRTRTIAAEGKRTLAFHRPIEGNVVYVTGELPVNASASEEVPVNNPAAFFAEQFRRALERNGVEVTGKTRTRNWLDAQKASNGSPAGSGIAGLKEIAGVDSLPMRQIAAEILKPSQNLYTDLVLAHVGEKARTGKGSDATATSEVLGIRELRAFLKKAGVPDSDVHFEEGSGLSRNNLTTANATIALLRYMSGHAAADAYWTALPVAGVDGTLRSRMKDTPAAGNVRAKTGTLRWAYSLSGDVRSAAGERFFFSIMLNRYYNTTDRSTRSEIDYIPVLLSEFAGRIDL